MSEDKKAILLRALKKGNGEKVKKLIESSPELDANCCADSADNRLLHRAARYGHLNVVQVLLNDLKADPNVTNKFGMTPLHHAAVAGDEKIVQFLIHSGANGKIADHCGRLPLHWACAYAYLDVARLLIEKGHSRCDLADKDGFTPMHRCCQESPKQDKNEEEEEEEETDQQVELDAEDQRRAELVQLLLKNGAKANAVEINGRQRPLHMAAMNGFTRTGKALVESGKADVNAVNKISKTALIYAASEDKTSTLEMLCKSDGIDLNQVDAIHNGWSALHYAVLQDNVEAVDILVQAGVDTNQRDLIGRSPYVIADDHYKEKVLAYFNKQGIKK